MILHRIFIFIGMVIFLAFFSGCAASTDPQELILAKINYEKITERDFVNALDPKLKQAYVQFKKQQLDRIISRKILEKEAKKRKISWQDLLKNEVFSKATVTHEETHAYYDKNKKQFGKKKSADAEIEAEKILQNQKAQELLKKFLSEISKKTKVQYFLSDMVTTTVPK